MPAATDWEVESETPATPQAQLPRQDTSAWEVESETPAQPAYGKQPPAGPQYVAPPIPPGLAQDQPSAASLFVAGAKAAVTVLPSAMAVVANTPILPLSKIPESSYEQITGDNPVAKGIVHGALKFGEQLSNPLNVGLIATADLPGLVPQIGKYLLRPISAVFTAGMLKSAYDKIQPVREAIDKGDYKSAADLITQAVGEGTFGALGAYHTASAIGAATEAHNVEAENLVQQEAQKETPVAGAGGTTVVGTKGPMEVRPVTLSPDGTVSKYDVVDPDSGEVLHSGDPKSVQDFLAKNGAKWITGNAASAPAEDWVDVPPETPAPAAPTQETTKGTTVETKAGTYTVTNITPTGKVEWTLEKPGGNVIKGSFPQSVFDAIRKTAIVAPPPVATTPAAAPAEAPKEDWQVESETPAAPQEVPSVNAENQRSEQPGETQAGGGTPAGTTTVPEGNRPGVVRQLPEQGVAGPGAGQPESVAGDQNATPGVHRVTGSADVSLTPQGDAQAAADASKVTAPNVQVFASPNARSEDTAKYLDTDSQPAAWLEPWRHGADEGAPTSEAKTSIADRVDNPDKSPGFSPISGEQGDTLNEFRLRYLPGLADQIAAHQPDQTTINVVSGSNLQMTRAWLDKGMPEDFGIDSATMKKEYKEAPGAILRLDADGKKLVPVDAITQPGIYFVHHAETPFNPAKGQAEPAGVAAEPLAPTTQIVGRVKNEEDGTEAVIAKIPAGYSVSLRDTDANQATGVARIYNTLEEAQAYADTVKGPAAGAPQVKEGDRVAWTDRRGKTLSGTVKAVYSDGTALIDTDQIMHAGGVPIGRIETVRTELLSPTKASAPAQAPVAKPAETKPPLGPPPSAENVRNDLQTLRDAVDKIGKDRATEIQNALMRQDGITVRGDNWIRNGQPMKSFEVHHWAMKRLHPAIIAEAEKPTPAQFAVATATPGPSGTVAENAAPPHIKLAMEIERRLRNGQVLGNNVEFQKLADEAFGGSRASGKYGMKEAYDAMEAGVNRYIADSIGPDLLSSDPAFAINQLRELMAKLPTQNIRSEGQESLQQFSTPPTLSFLVGKAAGIQPVDTVLEPSAGTGSLLAWAKAAGAIVRGNEIDPKRRELLGYAVRGSQPTAADAEFLNATLPADIKPTVVIMNPPFSATGGRLSANKNMFGYRHVLDALKRLEPNGRLVAILGEGATPKAQNAQQFWKDVARYGTLRANIGVSGKEYAKYGTTFGNRVIIIDKTPAMEIVEQTGKPLVLETGEYNTIEEAYNAIQPISVGRPRPASSAVAEPGRQPSGPVGQQPAVPGAGVRQPGTATAGSSAVTAPESRPPQIPGTSQGQESGFRPVESKPAEASSSAASDSGGSAVRPLREEDRVSLEARKEEDLLQRNEDDSSFVEYVPSIQGLAHPGRLVETKVMASTSAPKITYRPAFPAEAITKSPKPLSAAQMEVPGRAGMMHEQFNEAGERLAILVGDGTGVGKGQELASVVWDRNLQGTKRALWVSASADLIEAARGDFKGIGANDLAEKLFSIGNFKPAEDIDAKEGVVFSTYQSLIAKAKGERGRTRLEQIEKWLGPEGLIIFDEAHKAKNAVAGGPRAVVSKTGEAVVKLQADLPKAYIVYSSATAATDINNLGYMTRLGLWGPGTSFHQGTSHFMSEVGRGGVAAMEMISRELKAMGRYLSRSISYKGVSYEESTHELTPEQTQTYNAAAEAWQLVLDAAMNQIRDNNGNGSRERGEFLQGFWGTHQRFFRKLLTAMKVPTVLDIADKALAEGKSVVISLIGTGAAQADRAISAASDEDDDLDFSPKDSLIDMVQNFYPTILYEEYEDESGNIKKRPVIRDGVVQQNPEAVAKRDEIIKKLDKELQLPDNPLDFMIRYYGRDKVSELTSRKKTVERSSKTGKWEQVSRAPEGVAMRDINKYEMGQFQGGDRRVAIISKAAGTGISLHADLAAKNQQPRVQIVMELSWSADDQMQSFGRTHRTNQKQAPEYVIVSTNAGGEKRFSSTIARRLESLGALTKGQRDSSGGGSVLAKYNFETLQGEQASQLFYRHLMDDEVVPGSEITGQQALKQMGILKQRESASGEPVGLPYVDRTDETNVTRTLNRILNLRIEDQNAVFGEFTGIFDSVVQRAIEAGTLDTGVNLVRGDKIQLSEAKSIHKDPQSGAETYHYVVQVEKKNAPVAVDVVKDLHDKAHGKMYKRREYQAENAPSQLIWAVRSDTPITTRAGSVERAYNYFPVENREGVGYTRLAESELNQIYEPMEGAENSKKLNDLRKSIHDYEESLKSAKEGKDTYLTDYYTKRKAEAEDQAKQLRIKIDVAKSGQWDLWQKAYEAAPKSRTEKIHMIGGSVMRVWPYLNVGSGRMDIRIAYPETGGSITGVVMTEGDANRVERSLTGQEVARSPQSIFDAALRGVESFRLAGGIRMAQGRVNREPVVEFSTNDPNTERFLSNVGLQKERVGWKWRYYLPSDAAAGVPILEKVLKQFPVSESANNRGERGSIPMLSDLYQSMQDRFGSDAPKVNYSGMGAIKRWGMPGRQLEEVKEASREEVFTTALEAGGSIAQVRNIVQQAAPAITKALKGTDVTWDEMRLALVESNLRGKRQRWEDFAQQVTSSYDAEIEKSLEPNPDGTKSFYLDLLSKIEGRQGLAQDLAQTAVTLADAKEWPALREFLHTTFADAASRVATVMPGAHFDFVAAKLQNTPAGQEAVQLYKTLIADPIAQNHAINDGVFADTSGPLGIYTPLISMDRKVQRGPGRRLAYHKPSNPSNFFATGLSDDYDVSMPAFVEKMAAAFRANSKAQLLQIMEDSKWLQPESKGFKTDDGKFAMTGPDGLDYYAERRETSPARTIIKDGKVIHTGAQFRIMPRFMSEGLSLILERGPMNPDDVVRAMKWLNSIATRGPAELVFHSSGVMASLYANTPWLGESGLDKALSAPLVKWAAIRYKLFSIDPESPENIKKLNELSKAGALSASQGAVTYNRTFAELTGAKLQRFSFAPMLYGPRGLDVRARILMYDIWKSFNPNGSVADLHEFVNQIGNYTPEFQGEIERFLKRTALNPFATASMTRIVNSLQSYSGGPTVKQGDWKAKAAWLLLASSWAAIALWLVAHKLLKGKYPDKSTTFNEIPVGDGDGYIDQFRHSKLGDSLWGTKGVGRLNTSYFNNPLSARGARYLGAAGAFEANQLGGKGWQMEEAARKDILNTVLGIGLGPAAKAAVVLGTGVKPTLTGLRDRYGSASPQFFPAVPKGVAPGLPNAGARALAATEQLNSFYIDGAEHLGELTGLLAPNSSAKGNWFTQEAFQLAAPGLFSPATNPAQKAAMLRQQAVGAENQARRAAAGR